MLLGSNIDSIIKVAVEKYGTEATKAETKLDKVNISLTSGKGSLEGFSLANPEGFSSDNAMSFGKIEVEIHKDSVMSDGPIKIRRIAIHNPEILYEVNKENVSNLQAIQQNVAAYTSEVHRQAAEQAAAESKEGAEKTRKLVIEEIVLRGGRVKIKHAFLKDGTLADVHLPPVYMHNLGHGDRGVTAGMVAQRMLQQITSEALMTGQSNAMRELSRQGIDAAKEAAKQAGDVADKAGEAVEKAAEEAGKAVEDAGKALGNLLGK